MIKHTSTCVVGQRLASKTISKQTKQCKHTWIPEALEMVTELMVG